MASATVVVPFGQFSLELDVESTESAEFSKNLIPASAPVDARFVRADLFLLSNQERLLLLDRDQLGNAIQFLNLLHERIFNSIRSSLPDDLIEPGGLGIWLDSYFSQQDSDSQVQNDSYDLLNDKALAANNHAVISVYALKRKMFIEVWVRQPETVQERVWLHACEAPAEHHLDRAIRECIEHSRVH